jgi:hypothetical protein
MDFETAVATEMDKQQKALNDKLLRYRASWFVFMALIFAPAWFLASSVEGISFGPAVDVVRDGLEGLYFPRWLSSLVKYPVTALATIIPGSSLSGYWAVYLVFSSFSVIIFFALFMMVQPPNYRQMQMEAGLAPSRSMAFSFSTMIGFLLLSSIFGEVVSGYYRDPLADNYTGSVYLIDKDKKEIPIDAKVKLDLIDPGYIYDKKPGVRTRSWHIEFSGKDLPMLKSLGIDEKLFEGNVDAEGYGSFVCSAGKGTSQHYVPSFLGGAILLISNNYKGTEEHCPKSMWFGLDSFNKGQFAISDISKKYLVAARIERDTRFAWFQRSIMESRYEKDVARFFDNRNR